MLSKFRSKKAVSGFTLLEMLLALAIFAMLGLASYSVLDGTIRGHKMVMAQNQTLTDIQRSFTIMEADMVQLAQRYVRINGDVPTKVFFQAEQYLLDSESLGLAFVRDGWTNPAMVLPRSEMQFVGYRVQKQVLEKLYFNFVDAQMGEEPKVQPLLSGVTEIKLDYFYGNAWQQELPESGLPNLLKLTLATDSYGDIERVFPLIRMTTAVASQPDSDSNSDSDQQETP